MGYMVKLHREVFKALARRELELRKLIVRGLRRLRIDPYVARSGADIVRLKGSKDGEDLLCLRVGDFRAVCAVEGRTVYVTDLFHRGRGYD